MRIQGEDNVGVFGIVECQSTTCEGHVAIRPAGGPHPETEAEFDRLTDAALAVAADAARADGWYVTDDLDLCPAHVAAVAGQERSQIGSAAADS